MLLRLDIINCKGQMGVPPVEKAEKAVVQTISNGSDMKESVKEEKGNTEYLLEFMCSVTQVRL